MNTTIKVHEETRRKLKLLAALLDAKMVDVLERLVDDALALAMQEQKTDKSSKDGDA